MCPRPRKSLEEHALVGTKATYDRGKQTSHIPAQRPFPPKFLSEVAAKKFRALARVLDKRRVATAGDAELLAHYCVLWERWVGAQDHVSKEGAIITVTKCSKDGSTYQILVKNPWLTVAQATEKQMAVALPALGLTVNSRDKAKQTGANPENEVIPGSAEDFMRSYEQTIPINRTRSVTPEEMLADEGDEDATAEPFVE